MTSPFAAQYSMKLLVTVWLNEPFWTMLFFATAMALTVVEPERKRHGLTDDRLRRGRIAAVGGRDLHGGIGIIAQRHRLAVGRGLGVLGGAGVRRAAGEVLRGAQSARVCGNLRLVTGQIDHADVDRE